MLLVSFISVFPKQRLTNSELRPMNFMDMNYYSFIIHNS